MKAFYLLLLLVLILSSCSKNFLMLEDYYARASRKERKFLKSYHKTDSICIPIIKFHQRANLGTGAKGGASLTGNDIENLLRLSYSKSFNRPFCSSNKESIILRDVNFKKRSLDNCSTCCDEIIVPYLTITSYSYKNTEGGGGLTFVTDMGNDRHSFEYKLITSIYRNDTLIYMDNRMYWGKDLFSERGERLRYQVPQVVIDSLVTLTLQEYFKRVE